MNTITKIADVSGSSYDLIQHILNWPFLIFLLITVTMILFYEQLKSLVKNVSEITLKYRDEQISISEIPKKVKTNEQNIDSLNNDIKTLTGKIAKIEVYINKVKNKNRH